ncbi:MAG: glucose-6-phosphate dehydrogenase assembly protein OpcA [Bryobacteraceae bacterium]
MGATIQPDRILKDLAELWVSLAKPNGEASSGVLRACAMTLVVLADAAEDPNDIGETLASLMREHPSRVIVVRVSKPGEGGELAARVFAQCWMPFGQRRQICCEQIEITAPEDLLSDVPGVLLPLVVPDLPVILWCRISRLLQSPVIEDFAGIIRKVIIDTGDFDASTDVLRQVASAVRSGLIVADLSWTRLTRWRELIAQVFENPAYFSQLRSVTDVNIAYQGDKPSFGVFYMEAWLQACLEKAGSRPQVRLEHLPGDGRAGLSRTSFSSGDPASLSVSVEQVDGEAADVRVNALTNRTVFPQPSDYVLLREELAITGRDPAFESSLQVAARLAAEYPGES